MLYAQVVLGIPVEGPFDYAVPETLKKKIRPGMRVWVSFGPKRLVGYVVKLTHKTKIKNLKDIQSVIDEFPILDKKMLLLTKKLSDYYCCSWGEAIETALSEGLRKGKRIALEEPTAAVKENTVGETTLIHDLGAHARWDIYIDRIRGVLDNHKSVILIVPDVSSISKASVIIKGKLDCSIGILYRKQPKEIEAWLKIKKGEVNVVIGTRAAIFAPLSNLGLVIIDEEQDSVYKQDQVPHYHAREVASWRADIEKAKLILGSTAPSLEIIYLARNKKIKYLFIPRKLTFPEIKIIDMHHLPYADRKTKSIFTKFLGDAVYAALNSKEKILLFLNRKGFATFASCVSCGAALKCPRCNINLYYGFSSDSLSCHYCNFKMAPPKLCPYCNAGYIKYSGAGTEKIESELSRLFPSAKIKIWDNELKDDIHDADIVVATSSIIKQAGYRFGLIGVLGVDNSLNRIDFRAAEKTSAILMGLSALTEKKIIIQTGLTSHHSFQALVKQDMSLFYDEELRQRKQLHFPPYRHLALVKLRGRNEERVRRVSSALFEKLNKYNKDGGIKVISVNPAQPAKLRGNFYWQVLISSGFIGKVNRFLKINLKKFPHSGIIVTIDVDPL